ncbi:(Fe-S)-binding protein [Alicyclobacillus sp. SO9]|uniref:(Fe-S)-binding protein n=1 Tax=Alicyclobacillus sp. SO9 TaxID=2665646 RepID=UPI0018E710DC|nr:heterodisulfide reductase-related iron-sulfur binding cluster [Alicyclobacillus sp. SO9]QQE77880.1 4Fe-4S dicluster domain-containing protein [Alicyclobacillus sp. SO9]
MGQSEPKILRMANEMSSFKWEDAPQEDLYSVCVHCGFCLEVCPTYLETGDENESPRGRVYVIKEADKGNLELDEAVTGPVENCLDCRACETVCPSGVQVGSLIEQTRGQIYFQNQEMTNQSSGGTPAKRTLEKLFLRGIFPHPKRLRSIGKLTRLYQRSGLKYVVDKTGLAQMLPKHLQEMQAVMPSVEAKFALESLPPVIEAEGTRKATAMLFTGCVMDVMFSKINKATARVCTKNGIEVHVPKRQVCCGALQVHAGDRVQARKLARTNIDVFFQSGVDYVVINAAGCGSSMKEYAELFRDDPEYRHKAEKFSESVKDISELLIQVGLRPPQGRVERDITYQDACHLCHAQKIRAQPRQVLQSIPGLNLIEMSESDYCCGSAGIYNFTHPDMSGKLLNRKMGNIPSDVDGIAVGNPGCMMQLKVGAYRQGMSLEVLHTIELLDLAYQKEESRVERY